MRQTLITYTCSCIIYFMYFMRILVKVNGDNCEFNIESFIERGKTILGDHFWCSMTSDVTECAVTCIRRQRCVAFNYDMDSRICELTGENGFQTQISSKVKLLSRISKWPNQVDPDCYDRPCNDTEVCIPGSLGDRGTCSYTCLAMPARCPLPKGIKSDGPRTVGSTLTFTCDVGYRGGSSATCLSSLQWDNSLDKTCTPIYQSDCTTTEGCSDINGECVESKCVCAAGLVYKASDVKCLLEVSTHGLLSENIQCESNNFQRVTCPLTLGETLTIMDVSIIEIQNSSRPCTFGTSYGFTGSLIWVDNGCRAVFNVRACQNVSTVVCASTGYAYNTCNVPGTTNVSEVIVDEVLSSSACTKSISYGIIGDSIWVNNGCRARFLVCND